MKILILLPLLLTSCTPFEREIAEEVCHEASVAERAIEADLNHPMYGPECPGMENKAITGTNTSIKRKIKPSGRHRGDLGP